MNDFVSLFIWSCVFLLLLLFSESKVFNTVFAASGSIGTDVPDLKVIFDSFFFFTILLNWSITSYLTLPDSILGTNR